MKLHVIIPLVLVTLFALQTKAQSNQSPSSSTQSFGVINKSDLEMTSCDFEKDANAEILFDKCDISFDQRYERDIQRHIRLKIFTDESKNATNIKLRYFTGNHSESITDLEAETINLTNGVIEITKVDKQQFFTQRVNKFITEIVFSFPAVKAGSVVEYKYTLTSRSLNIPDWYFQAPVPTRYSEIRTEIPNVLSYKSMILINQPFAKNTDEVKALANVPSIKPEPYMGAIKDNVDRIVYQLTNISGNGVYRSYADSWQKIAEEMIGYEDFGGQFTRKLTGEMDIINRAKSLPADKDKIAYIFNEVKKQMKWNDATTWYTSTGIADAWDKKTGSSAEINLILYHLLYKSGLKAFPMLVSTRNNGKVYPSYPNKNQFNKVITFIPIDTANYYVLDASNKYYPYNEIPRNLLSNFGLCIVPDEEKKYNLVFLQKSKPALQTVYLVGEIASDGKINGSAEINSYSYNRINALERYKADGDKKYMTYLRDKDNNLKITGLKIENMDTDTLPLKQIVNFTLAPATPDDNYIYFSPNLFTRLKNNPFLSERRLTDIDLEYRNNYVVNGTFKIPAGYKADVLPQNISLVMPDKSISFKRQMVEQNGSIAVIYVIDYKKSWYSKEDYPEIHEFFKKMYEMLNEQVVLKKS